MKRHIIISNLMVLILLGCNGPTGPSSQNSAPISFLSGQIDNWNYGSHRHITLTQEGVQINSANIDFAGRFSLQYLVPPPNSVKLFHSYALLSGIGDEILENTSACSDSSSMIIDGHLLVGNDSSSSWLGYITRESRSVNLFGTIGDFRVNYYYASKQVNLTGTIKTRDLFGSDSAGLEVISQYDLFFAKGWNEEVQSIISQSVYVDSGKTITSIVYSYTNIEPAGGKWIYSGN
jgi:hypothetical protein